MTLADLQRVAAEAEVPPPVGCAWSRWSLGYNNEAMLGRRLALFDGPSYAIIEIRVAVLEELSNDQERIALVRLTLNRACEETTKFIVGQSL